MNEYVRVYRDLEPRVIFLLDQHVQVAANITSSFYASSDYQDLPRKGSVMRMGRDQSFEFAREKPIQITNVITSKRHDIDFHEIYHKDLTEEVVESDATFNSSFAVSKYGKEALRRHPRLLQDLFTLGQSSEQIKIHEFNVGIRRITLQDGESFLLKQFGGSSHGLFQLEMYMRILSFAESQGYTPEQILAAGASQHSKSSVLALTSPRPLFATHNTLAMTELTGFTNTTLYRLSKEGINSLLPVYRPLALEGIDLASGNCYHELMFSKDPDKGVLTIAIVDPHPSREKSNWK